MKKLLLCALSLLAAVLMIAGCGGGDKKTEKPAPAKTEKSVAKHMNIALFWLDKSLEPAEGWNAWSLARAGASECLTTIDENMKLTPVLADKWEQVDPVTWKIHIRKGVKFSNGKEMTPEDVKKTIERAVGKDKRAAANANLDSIKVDGENIIYKTKAPYGALMYNLSEPLFTIIDTSKPAEEIAKTPVTTAPYMVTSFKSGEVIELKANPNYWGGKPGLDSITVKLIKDDNTRAMALQSGEIDIAQKLDKAGADLFKGKSEFNTLEVPSLRLEFAFLNLKHPFLANANVRKAMAMAVDRDAMAKLFNGEPCGTVFPKAAGIGFEKLNKQTFNLEEAKKLLAQEGFKDTNGDGIIEKDGKPFELTLQIFKKTAIPEALQAQLAKAGIKINIRQMDDTQKNLEEGKFDMSLNSYITAVTGDGQRILEQNFSTKGADNYGKYSNPEYDAVIAKLAGEFDAAKRVELETEAQKILLQDTPDLFLVSSKTIIVTKNSVKNLKKYPLDYYLISKDTTM